MTEARETQLTKHSFYFETPLYDYIKAEDLPDELVSEDVDAWSSANGIDTTYDISAERMSFYPTNDFYNFYKVTLTCVRKGEVLIFFIYKVDKGAVKVGQLPSLASIQFGEIDEKYTKILSKDNLKLFKKAIGLASHGTGAGSFVYLRRIFEDLIKQSFNDNKDVLGIDEATFLSKRMAEKVDTLREFLPSELLEMKGLYAILSSGVHELS